MQPLIVIGVIALIAVVAILGHLSAMKRREAILMFPSSVIAGMFGFEPQDYFNVPPSVREVPDAQFG